MLYLRCYLEGDGFGGEPVGFEAEGGGGGGSGEDVTSEDGLAVALEGYVRCRMGEEHVVGCIQDLDGDVYVLLVRSQEREAGHSDVSPDGR